MLTFVCLFFSVEMYFPQNDSWIGLAPLNIPRYEFGICVLDQKVYVIGGIETNVRPGITIRKHENSYDLLKSQFNFYQHFSASNEQ